MTAAAITLADSGTMLGRVLRRMRRYPSLTLFVAGLPVVLMLMFVYVFGGTLGAGLPGSTAGSGREAYIAYVVPAILLMAIAGAGQGTAISVSMDMTAGIIARFRTMAIARSAVLAGHVLGSIVQSMLAVLIVLVVAVVIGFRPTTGPMEWLAAAGLMVLVAAAMGSLTVGMGLSANSVETASNTPMILSLLPFLGSGFVPTATMPEPLRWFAEVQPFTPMNEALRALLLGTPMGSSLVVAVAWCVGISVAGYLWSRRLYERLPVRPAG